VLSGIQRDYAAKGVQVIGVGYNPDAALLALQFSRTFAPNFPVGYRDRDTVNAYLQVSPMVRNYVPNVVVIDRGWTIRAQYAGDDPFFQNEDKNMRALLDGLLKQAATKKGSKPAPKKKKK
jgi:hypothetical protein